jgi:hypothetical protein
MAFGPVALSGEAETMMLTLIDSTVFPRVESANGSNRESSKAEELNKTSFFSSLFLRPEGSI